MKKINKNGVSPKASKNGTIVLTVLAVIFSFFSIVATAQKIDSLKMLLGEKVGIARCDALNDLAHVYFGIDNKLCFEYASQAFKIASEYGDSLRIVHAGRIKSAAFRRLDEFDSSLILATSILPVSMRNGFTEDTKSLLNGIAMAYTFQAQYDKALSYQFQSLRFREQNGDKADVSIALLNIGFNYYKIKDYDQALSYSLKSLALKKEVNDNFDIESLLVNISLCYAYKDDYKEAQRYLDQLREMCNGHCSSFVVSNSAFNSGVISFRQRHFFDAETHFLESYQVAKADDNQRLLLDNIVYLSQVYIQTGHLKTAEMYLKEAEALIAKGTPYSLELIKIYHGLYTFYASSKDFQKVSHYQEKYIQLKDSIYNEELTRNLMKVEAEYLERENNAKIKAQAEILLLNEAVIFRQKMLNIFIGVVAFLLILLALALAKNIRQKRLTNRFLEQKVKERTKDLELSRDSLQRALDRRDIVFGKVSTDIKRTLATIRGLYALGLTDDDIRHRKLYIRKIEITAEKLLLLLERTFSNATVTRYE